MLDGTSALVAGGASGLGAATASALTAAGASVVIFDRDERRGLIVSKELGCQFHGGDITVAGDVAAAVDHSPALPVAITCVAAWLQTTLAADDGARRMVVMDNLNFSPSHRRL